MGCKYVKEFEFGSDKGFTGSAGKTQVKGYARGGKVSPEVREAVHRHEREKHPKEPLTALKKGGMYEKATGERYASKAAMVKHERKETPRMEREEVMQKTKQVRKGPAMAAGLDPRVPMLKCGGMYKKK